MGIRPPGPLVGPMLEWRAARIVDPVERLRFLRVTTARVSRPWNLGLKRLHWQALVPVALWALVFVPMPGPSTVRSSSNLPVFAGSRPQSQPANAVWLVEETSGFEIYSNGLRVEKQFVTANRARGSYAVFRRDNPGAGGEESIETRTQPSGIVFHSTESHQAPFAPAETRNLKRLGRALLEFVRQEHAYHYLIDRFGRVYRVVLESDTAFHAGKSAWADSKVTYVNLNDAFLGVAFEAQTSADAPVSHAQISAARILTEMLRSKYGIDSADCATHAQVSVNQANWQIGYHTDWATGFPWAAVGLPDNYSLPLASIYAFGFDYDDAFLQAAGNRRWPGLQASVEQFGRAAMTAGRPAGQYRRQLQERFQNVLNSAAMRERGEEQ